VRTDEATLLLDCGLFQGHRREAIERNATLGVDPSEVDAVILSHAHIDHAGALPLLVKNGYDGPIYATPATRDLCAAMLADAATIQAADARYINKVIERDGVDMLPVEPLYTAGDVTRTLALMFSVPYHQRHRVAEGIELTYLDAGHVLGSAISVLDVVERGATKRLVFTGDLGRHNVPILRDPEVPQGADALIMESTYGDRIHPPIERVTDELGKALARAYARKGRVIIPSFALERAQEVLYALAELKRRGALPPMPVYVDSPLTVRLTDVFRLHPECFDDEARELLARHESPFDFEGLRYVEDVEESKALDASREPAVIIAASGMCEGGRVVHHLKASIEQAENMVIIVGFQAQHTLGRRIVERRPRVRIFGVERDLRAEVVILNGMSAHADQTDLVSFACAVRGDRHLDLVALVHGEPGAQETLRTVLARRGFDGVRMPERGDRAVV
jgi:metallo-beta-lactamase family protein